jgi:competence protein ComEC
MAWPVIGWVSGIAASGAMLGRPAVIQAFGSPWLLAGAAAGLLGLGLSARRAPGLSFFRRPALTLLAAGLCAGLLYGQASFSRLEAVGAALASHGSLSGTAAADSRPLGISTCVPVTIHRPRALVMVALPPGCAEIRMGEEVSFDGGARALRRTRPKDVPALLRGEAAFAQAERVVSASPTRGPFAFLYRWRGAVLDGWSSSGWPESGLLRAVVFADASGLDEAARGDFKRSGLAHLVAASGAYAAVLALLAAGFARRVGAPQAISRLSAIAVVVAYGALTGPSPSVMRSALILATYALAWSSGRRVAALAPIAVAAFLISAVSPFAVFSTGFALSLGAVVAIAFWAAPIRARLARAPEPLRRPLSLALAVQVGLAPLLAADFSQVSTVAPLASAVVWPLLPPMLGMALASALAAAVPRAAAAPLGAAAFAGACLLARVMMAVAHAFASPSWAAIPVAGLPVLVWPVYYLCVEGLLRRGLVARSREGDAAASRRRRRVTLFALVLALLVSLGAGLWPTLSPAPRGLEVRIMDVGQGDAILLKTPARHVVLVDGGPSAPLVMRRLAQAGVGRIDLVVVTHPHTDHYTGLEGVIADLPVRELWESPEAVPDDGYSRVLALARRRGVRVRAPPAGARAVVDPWLTLTVLSPDGRRIEGSDSDANNNGLVLVASCGRVRFLLAADIQDERQSMLGPVACDVYKVAHHGSRHSLDQRFLDGLGAKLAVVSVGAGNRFGHPSAQTLDELARRGMRVLRTDRDGTVTTMTDGRTLSLVH